jgi:hypothetical protein
MMSPDDRDDEPKTLFEFELAEAAAMLTPRAPEAKEEEPKKHGG